MNKVEQALSEDLVRLTDRLATSIPEHALARMRATAPAVGARLDAVEANLAAARSVLIDTYARWTRGLEDLENLYALAIWQSAMDESAAEVHARAA